MDQDADLVRSVAVEFIQRSGVRALAELYDFADIAAGLGDQASVEAWQDIAEAAEALLKAADPAP
jgi:hypothetical protein